ncbi:urease accessory protein UreF [Poseidonocella sedimentorum]|uniref:Urease accessory protein UreF n=1 Tax=Poseidonocella sedimentorum TaxID=871652 RepID=A0A1I6CN42_9RHOB|nr:urease accessory UreF family protein [Poseidonocella sedimentorum]SFQ94561.1 urease accessory protein [Poseidonocella sedimentorum]
MSPAPMPPERAALLLAQWLSPAFPVGAFAYSHGLERAIADGAIASADDLQAWLEDLLTHGSAWSDAIFLAGAYRAENDAARHDISERARAFAASAERRFEADQQGEAFARTTAAVWDHPKAAQPYPVALGTAAAREGLPLRLTLRMALQAFAANLTSAALRLVPLGQTDGQRVLTALVPLIETQADAAECAQDDALSSTTWLADIAAMRHETQATRLFRT